MQDVRNRTRKGQARPDRHKARIEHGPPPPRGKEAPPGHASRSAIPSPPFLLAPPPLPPAFPLDVRVPPHRGALIVSARSEVRARRPAPAEAEYLVTTPAKSRPKTRPKTKQATKPPAAPGAGAAAKRKRAAPATAKPRRRAAAKTVTAAAALEADLPAVAAAPQVAAQPLAAAVPPFAAEPAAMPTLAAVPAEMAAPATPPQAVSSAVPTPPVSSSAALPRSRALVRPDQGMVGRLVAWLGRLVPRKRAAALPQARTRLARPPEALLRPGPGGSAPAAGAEPPATGGELTQRMLLQLSDENERLRLELAALRARLGEPAPR